MVPRGHDVPAAHARSGALQRDVWRRALRMGLQQVLRRRDSTTRLSYSRTCLRRVRSRGSTRISSTASLISPRASPYSASWLSGLFDNYVVDGLVNFASNVTFAVGGRLRRLQTGSINGYLYGILAGGDDDPAGARDRDGHDGAPTQGETGRAKTEMNHALTSDNLHSDRRDGADSGAARLDEERVASGSRSRRRYRNCSSRWWLYENFDTTTSAIQFAEKYAVDAAPTTSATSSASTASASR